MDLEANDNNFIRLIANLNYAKLNDTNYHIKHFVKVVSPVVMKDLEESSHQRCL